ncbi:MAG TPA: NAD(P)/FAD-dependent oxidoreductase [Phenylobacterium sp.]|nr:NAD(P)/FAD-dependent oxidoreductase [Phenylobacterium sp.]
MTGSIDCLIIGGGPAGLTAAIYAARFRLDVLVVDEGRSRAALIPCTRNHAGFPGGISGQDLVARMREQAVEYGVRILADRVTKLSVGRKTFSATAGAHQVKARAVLLATGVTNRRPEMSEDLHRRALAAGRLRYCPVCDGFEVIDQAVAVIGTGERGAKEALFLRAYTPAVTLVAPNGRPALTPAQISDLDAAGIARRDGPVSSFRLAAAGLTFACAGEDLTFDAVYPAMGSDPHSDLAASVGAEIARDGCVKVDAHQRTSRRGLYAAGDVVLGLDQISHAMGQAGVAATAIRNDLAAESPMRR